jgi:micrococcal nuclease
MRINVILLIIFVLINSAHLNRADKKDKYVYYKVRKVVDGDTFWIDDDTPKGLKIRLTGIDAPESRNSGTKEIAYFGREATDYLTRLLSGKRVRLEYDVAQFDRYGRTLAYAFLEDGTFVNAKMVRDGYANIMTIPPNVKYADTFLKLERKARNQNRGMWKVTQKHTLEY